MRTIWKQPVTLLGALISLGNLLWYAQNVWLSRIELQSPASWLMWTLLDVLLLGTTIAAKKPMWLPLSYTIGAGAVTVSLFARGAWLWSWKESACAAGVVISTILWRKRGNVAGMIAGISAMTLAGLPLFIDLVRHPIPETFPVWGLTVLACICTLLGSDWSLAGTALAWSGLAFNGSLAVIVMR